MKPSIKLTSISFGLATAIIFTAWTKISEFSEISNEIKIVAGGLISLGLYRLIANSLIELAKNSSLVKKKLLGPYYLEGTWVGFYIGAGGKERYIVEKFEQDIDNLVIRGKSFDENYDSHATWVATPVNIDTEKGKISYMYDCEPLNGNTNGNGVAIFNFERKDQYTCPTALNGYSSDLHVGVRIKAKEIKISDQCSISENDALAKAIKLFEECQGKI